MYIHVCSFIVKEKQYATTLPTLEIQQENVVLSVLGLGHSD